MGYLFTLLTSFFLSLFPVGDVPYSAVESAFSANDASKIVSFGKDKMHLTILEKDGVYAPSQAAQVLKDFFSKAPVSSFKFSYKGGSGDTATAVGSYVSKSGTYRVTIRFVKVSSDFKIESISIE